MSELILDTISRYLPTIAGATSDLANDVTRMDQFETTIQVVSGHPGLEQFVAATAKEATEFWIAARKRAGDQAADYRDELRRNLPANDQADPMEMVVADINVKAVELYKAIGNLYLREIHRAANQYPEFHQQPALPAASPPNAPETAAADLSASEARA